MRLHLLFDTSPMFWTWRPSVSRGTGRDALTSFAWLCFEVRWSK